MGVIAAATNNDTSIRSVIVDPEQTIKLLNRCRKLHKQRDKM